MSGSTTHNILNSVTVCTQVTGAKLHLFKLKEINLPANNNRKTEQKRSVLCEKQWLARATYTTL